MTWWDTAACKDKGVEPADFDTDPLRDQRAARARERAAKLVCFRCPITTRRACLNSAVREEADRDLEPFGVRGGHTPEERAPLVAKRRALLAQETRTAA
jgi:transcription factor WhiB